MQEKYVSAIVHCKTVMYCVNGAEYIFMTIAWYIVCDCHNVEPM